MIFQKPMNDLHPTCIIILFTIVPLLIQFIHHIQIFTCELTSDTYTHANSIIIRIYFIFIHKLDFIQQLLTYVKIFFSCFTKIIHFEIDDPIHILINCYLIELNLLIYYSIIDWYKKKQPNKIKILHFQKYSF